MSKHFVTGNSFQSLLPYFTRAINEKTSWPRNVENFTRVYFVFFFLQNMLFIRVNT